jgi:hypothetical protein
LAFFTKYWTAQKYEVTTDAIVQFTTNLERAQTRMQGISTKAMLATPRSWQGNAYSLVHHYNQQNWANIDEMIAAWRAEPHFNNLVLTTEAIDQSHGRDLRQPDWWTKGWFHHSQMPASSRPKRELAAKSLLASHVLSMFLP